MCEDKPGMMQGITDQDFFFKSIVYAGSEFGLEQNLVWAGINQKFSTMGHLAALEGRQSGF